MQKGTIQRGDCLMMHVLSDLPCGGAILVPNKIGNAVKRNRCKRSIRAAINENSSNMPKDKQIVFRPQNHIREFNFHIFARDIDSFFSK
ncbi:MAG: ribonuclease P protein component [Candidatus Marinimicrobia bacterium]|nr:ribonuclease P protein component [Candidatus Neomarinimicrobiota bacterium]